MVRVILETTSVVTIIWNERILLSMRLITLGYEVEMDFRWFNPTFLKNKGNTKSRQLEIFHDLNQVIMYVRVTITR